MISRPRGSIVNALINQVGVIIHPKVIADHALLVRNNCSSAAGVDRPSTELDKRTVKPAVATSVISQRASHSTSRSYLGLLATWRNAGPQIPMFVEGSFELRR